MSRKISVLIVDDDPIGRTVLRTLVSYHDGLVLLGEAEDAAAAARLIGETKPDAIFLDVRMPGASGFDLLRTLEAPPRVVFVTSSPGHMLEAFEAEALDYLLKPVQAERFAATVRRLERLVHGEAAPVVRHEKTDRICLRSDGHTHVVPVSRLVALQAEGNFTRVFCADGTSLLIGKSLGDFEETLPSTSFARLDRSQIMNLDRVNRTERKSRDLCLLWLNGLSQPLELGRTAMSRLRELLERTGQQDMIAE